MQAELKAKWIAALRSGKYRQGKDVLRSTDNKFCCLGVLADVCGETWDRVPNASYFRAGRNHSRWYGADERHFGPDTEDKLTRMNDTGESFAAIAAWIEAEIPAEPASPSLPKEPQQ